MPLNLNKLVRTEAQKRADRFVWLANLPVGSLVPLKSLATKYPDGFFKVGDKLEADVTPGTFPEETVCVFNPVSEFSDPTDPHTFRTQFILRTIPEGMGLSSLKWEKVEEE